MLLGHRNHLRRIADLYAECTSGRGDAEVLVAEATHEIERFLCRLLLCEAKRVGLDLPLDGSADLRRRTKEAVCRDAAVDALVRALEVVVLDVELEPPKAVREVGEHGLAQKFFPQCLPEAFDLSQRLGVLRPALAVANAATPK